MMHRVHHAVEEILGEGSRVGEQCPQGRRVAPGAAQLRNIYVQVFVDADEDSLDRHASPLTDLGQELLDYVACLTLAQKPSLAQFGISAPCSVRVCQRQESFWPLSFSARSNLILRRLSSSVW